jgi:hypothetical protein
MSIQRFSASVAEQHMNCHASANLEAAIPGLELPVEDRTVDNAANRGTSFHTEMERLMNEYSANELDKIAASLKYVSAVRRLRRFKVLTEAKGTGWWLSQKPGTTSDLVLYVADEIHVLDYKFGKIPVAAKDNAQGKYYSLAFSPLAPKAKGVHFHIVQPFADNYDSVFFTAAELEQFRVDTANADRAIQNGSTTFGPTDKGCLFCPANPHSRGAKATKFCPVMMQMLYPVKVDEDAILDDVA